jgi:pyridoxine kinase
MTILSFQSAVTFGHVGNSAAAFPLQRLGFDVWPVDTVQFSNHPGYGQWTGMVHPASHIHAIIDGLDQAEVLGGCDAVLSGYLGEEATGEAVLEAVTKVRAQSIKSLFLCDPVMGDDGRLYVRPGIPEFLARRAVPAAHVITPNRFELEYLSGMAVGSVAEAERAARTLLSGGGATGPGPRMVVATGIESMGMVATLVVTADGSWAVRTPLLSFPQPPSGTGDTLAALLLARLLRGEEAPEALALAVSSLYGVLATTLAMGRRELALVAAQDELVVPSRFFPPLPLA